MLKRFQDYIENGPWERYLEDDDRAFVIFCWVALIFSAVWFGGSSLPTLIWGPGK